MMGLDCQTFRDRLFEAERPDAVADPAFIAHRENCADCRALTDRLQRLETLYRKEAERPAPRSDSAREAFVRQHVLAPTRSARWRPSASRSWRWAALAAAILLCFGVGVLAPWPQQQVQASADLVDRLVDWNLELSETPILSARARIHDEQAEALRAESERLAEADRELADALLDNADWLARNEDPVGRAERFDKLANRLLKRMSKDAERRDAKAMRPLARQYGRVQEFGVEANVRRARTAKSLDPRGRARLDGLDRENGRRSAEVEAVLQAVPEASRKEVRRLLKLRTPANPAEKKKNRRQTAEAPHKSAA